MRFPVLRVLVRGPSMAPTLRPGDQLLVLRRGRARPGALVVVRLPDLTLAVKRFVRNVDSALWVEGDNPYGSTDSRTLGPLPVTALEGVAIARIWPRPRLLGRAAAPPRAIPD